MPDNRISLSMVDGEFCVGERVVGGAIEAIASKNIETIVIDEGTAVLTRALWMRKGSEVRKASGAPVSCRAEKNYT